jgi:hypothetical protein
MRPSLNISGAAEEIIVKILMGGWAGRILKNE